MASIRKRNGRYQVQVRTVGTSPQSRTFSLRADAETWAKVTELAIERGAIGDHSLLKETLGSLLNRYLVEITPNKRGRVQESCRIRRLLRDQISKLSLIKLTPQELASFRDRRLADGLRASSYDLVIIRHCLNIARREWGYPISTNPIDLIRKPSPPRPRDRRLTPEEYSRLEATSSQETNTRLWPIINLAIETGMRAGELFGLRWTDIDLDRKTAYLGLTKNGLSRTVPLSPRAIEWLNEIRGAGPNVFPVSRVTIRHAWDRLLRAAGISDLHFHDLRHEAITRFFEMGLSIPEVALISGHKDPKMLFRYTHLRAENVAAKLWKQSEMDQKLNQK